MDYCRNSSTKFFRSLSSSFFRNSRIFPKKISNNSFRKSSVDWPIYMQSNNIFMLKKKTIRETNLWKEKKNPEKIRNDCLKNSSIHFWIIICSSIWRRSPGRDFGKIPKVKFLKQPMPDFLKELFVAFLKDPCQNVKKAI